MAYTERFNKFMEVVLRWECGSTNGYVNDPRDSGGMTIYGLCRKLYPNLLIWKSIDRLPTTAKKKAYKPTKEELDEVYSKYYNNYYLKSKANLINDPCLALQVFDFAVNAGVTRSVKTLQSILGVEVDGVIGKITLGAANKGEHCRTFLAARNAYYQRIANNGQNGAFLKGWLNRSEAVYNVGESLENGRE